MASTTCSGCIEGQLNQMAHMDEGGCLYEHSEEDYGFNDYDLGCENLHDNSETESETGEDYEYVDLDGKVPDALMRIELSKVNEAKHKISRLEIIIKQLLCDEYKSEIKSELIKLIQSIDK